MYYTTTLRPFLLWVHVGPSQPSLQTQVNESPVTTQVPPFSHGFGRQLEFLAENRERKVKFDFVSELSQTTKRIISTIMNLNPTQTAFDWAFFSLLLPDSLNFPFFTPYIL